MEQQKKIFANQLHPQLYAFTLKFRRGWISTIQESLYAILEQMETHKIKKIYTKEGAFKQALQDASVKIPEVVVECTNDFRFAHTVKSNIKKIAEQLYPISRNLDWYVEMLYFLQKEICPKRNAVPTYNEASEKMKMFIEAFLS